MVPVLLLAAACAAPGEPALAAETAAPAGDSFVLRGARVVRDGGAEGAEDVRVEQGVIVAVGEDVTAGGGDQAAAAPVVDLAGRWIAPAFVDSHVHLAYLPAGEALADGGIAAAVDLASPIGFLGALPPAPRVIGAGPMITAPGGYPTRSWGRHGYGAECGDAACATAAVEAAAAAGARVVKVPLGMPPELDDATLAAVVVAAHARGLPVAAHALDDASAARAAAFGVDILAHTPVGELAPSTVAAWSGRAVVSTLGAFGGAATTVANLRALRAAGATVLYGTDFGNTRTAGIDPAELTLLAEAGLDGPAILAAGTYDAARAWGLDDLGEVAPGKEASLLVLDADPRVDPSTLTRPVTVYFRGQPR